VRIQVGVERSGRENNSKDEVSERSHWQVAEVVRLLFSSFSFFRFISRPRFVDLVGWVSEG